VRQDAHHRAANSHEIIVMPTSGCPRRGDYAVACAVPVDAPGLSLVFGRQSNDERKEEAGTFDCGTEWGWSAGRAR